MLLWLACKPTLIDLVPDTGRAAEDAEEEGEGEDEEEDVYTGAWGWVGERRYNIGDRCDGELLDDGVELYDATFHLEAACPDCERFFELVVNPDEICGLGVYSPTWRGLSDLGGDRVGIWSINEGEDGWQADLLAEADDGDVVEYAWSAELGDTWYEASGWFELRKLDE
ncbi:MAG: hypothetical protein GY884_36415 [Proteobacteria bacterium]|nr:hypothetical protein [Pseudomonadota bacterium]